MNFFFVIICSEKCANCEKSLTKSSITDDEFQSLTDYFEKEMLDGKQDYHKLKPEDWINLQKYIKKRGPFDVIVDGMNVALGSLCDDWRISGKLIDYRRANVDEVNSIRSFQNPVSINGIHK